MRPIPLTAILLLSFGAAALADDQNDRQKLLGSWDLQGPAENSPASSWVFSPAKDSIRVAQLEGANKVADFACSTRGTSCEVKTGGKKATVSMWFNGPKLVELDTKPQTRRVGTLPLLDPARRNAERGFDRFGALDLERLPAG